MAEKQKKMSNGHASEDSDDLTELMKRSRRWLLQCLRLFQSLDYEDERLQEHATELVKSLNDVLGEPLETEAESAAEEDDWDDDDENDDDDSSSDDDEMDE
jgi:hypothetical protein